MESILALLALLSGIVGTFAYIPQILHMVKEKSSKGTSLSAWILWLTTGLVILAYAIEKKEFVFVTIMSVSSAANLAVVLLTVKYRKKN
ncbi:MAG: SemiSWEET family transporter [Nanoarchaeota archaeon]